ncbi:MAG: anthranilate synthase component I [Verrucomicrobia bacterium]|nr:anthranilate synthase component I [Verrucomicrobiota bacterium]
MYYPTKSEFRSLASRGNLIPVYCELLADLETPVSAYQKLRGKGPAFLFESVEGGEHISRYSFIGADPGITLVQDGGAVVVREGRKTTRIKFKRDPLEVVEKVMARYRPVALPELPRFSGGAVGFLGYEFIHHVEPVVPRPKQDDLGTPPMYLMLTDTIVIFDRVRQTIKVVSNAHVTGNADVAYDKACRRIAAIIARLRRPLPARHVELRHDAPPLPVDSNMTVERYQAMVRKAKEYIKSGDIIQVVLSQRFSTKVRSKPLDVYRALRSVNPSPYMFILELGDFSLVGASPEVHVRCEDGHVEIRPIAGTRKRGVTPAEDLALEKDLLADEKERAEHLMLVDLARNDIGRVCDFGSVHVEEFMIIERYSHVMHIVSQVEGNLQKDRTVYDLMRATFPAGTVSGAPKIRAMQIIAEQEASQRGPYAGAVGYFSFNGNLDCCITLRTALLKGGRVYVQAGGGIVDDSTPENEFQETVNKSMALRKAIALAESFRK